MLRPLFAILSPAARRRAGEKRHKKAAVSRPPCPTRTHKTRPTHIHLPHTMAAASSSSIVLPFAAVQRSVAPGARGRATVAPRAAAAFSARMLFTTPTAASSTMTIYNDSRRRRDPTVFASHAAAAAAAASQGDDDDDEGLDASDIEVMDGKSRFFLLWRGVHTARARSSRRVDCFLKKKKKKPKLRPFFFVHSLIHSPTQPSIHPTNNTHTRTHNPVM